MPRLFDKGEYKYVGFLLRAATDCVAEKLRGLAWWDLQAVMLDYYGCRCHLLGRFGADEDEPSGKSQDERGVPQTPFFLWLRQNFFAQHGEVEEIGIEFKRAQHRAAQAVEAHPSSISSAPPSGTCSNPPDGGVAFVADIRDIGDDSQPAAAVEDIKKIGLDQSMAI